jgi:tetratricopeptide (TPR) repeat protein
MISPGGIIGLTIIALLGINMAGCDRSNKSTPLADGDGPAHGVRPPFECPAPESPELLNQEVRTELLRRLEACRGATDNADTVGELGMAYHAADMLVPAENCYRRCVEIRGSDPRWRYYLAVVSSELGKLEETRDNLERFLMDEPLYAPALYRLGQLSLQQDDVVPSQLRFRALTNLNPPSPGGFLGLGLVHKRRGDWDSAIRFFQRAVQLDPRLDDGYFQLSILYRRIDRPDLADEAARHVRSDRTAYQPPDPLLSELGPLQSGAKVLISRGYKAIEAQQYPVAVATFQRLLDQEVDHPFPKHYGALVGMARAYRESGQFNRAEETARKAISINDTFPDARIEMARIKLGMGRHEEALNHARAACSDPPSPAAYELRAQAAKSLELWDEAVESYREAIKLVPMVLTYSQQLIELLEQLERWDDAAGECERILNMAPGHPAAMQKLEELKTRAAR